MHGAPAALVAGRLASPARVCAGSRSPLPAPSAAGSRTIPLCVISAVVVDVAALEMVDVVVLPPEAPKQNVVEPSTLVEGRVACDADPDVVGNEPRPVVPRPLVPRPAVPRPAMPTPATSSELTELDEGEDRGGSANLNGGLSGIFA
jgi:hypothetical protein